MENIVQKTGISQGSKSKVSLNEVNSLEIEKAEKHKMKYTLNTLLDQCTDNKRHEIIDIGTVGKEIL